MSSSIVIPISRAKRMVLMCTQTSSLKDAVTIENESRGCCSIHEDFDDDDSISDSDYEIDDNDREQLQLDENTEMELMENKIIEVEDGDKADDDVETVQNEEVIPVFKSRVIKRRRKDVVKQPKLNKIEKEVRDKSKHKMRPRCSEKCKRNCNIFTDEDRNIIWDKYWSLDYSSRRKWLAKNVQLVDINRRTVNASTNFKKNNSRLFFLSKDYKNIRVCRTSFLNTLGYTNDSVITELCHVMKKEPICAAVKENRGVRPKPKCDRDLIKKHIESYKPYVAHYRRYNAPNIRYLPRELTLKSMFEDFNINNPGVCKIETYRLTLKDMHIFLCMPKSDICEDCYVFKMQETDDKNSNKDLSTQKMTVEEWNAHRLKATKATNKYKSDALIPESNTTRIYSMDLQKVILLPNMPSAKESYFTSRLVVFNETFASLKKESKTKNYCAMWHEAIAGRNAQNIVDSILRVIEEERDVKEFIFWADNCTAQNKNWILYTALVIIVNEKNARPNSITIRYLTKGHTHMSADGIHGNIEKKINKIRNVYDLKDLTNAVEASRQNVKVVEVTAFHNWEKKKRASGRRQADPLKDFNMNSVVEVKFEAGCRNLKYKTDFDEDFVEINFLQNKFDFTMRPNLLPSPRGILKAKKENIIKVLVPMMPSTRGIFWTSIPENDKVSDLTQEIDVD